MERIHVLAIAPYEGLGKLFAEVAEECSDIEMQVCVGDLEAGVKLVSEMKNIEFDFIISRGGTAIMIEQYAHIPVVTIHLSQYDVLQAIKMAQGFSEKFCVVGFPDIIQRVKIICELLGYNIDTRVINEASQVADCLAQLKSNGYSLIIGDTIAVTTAKSMQMTGVLIISNRESVIEALDEGRAIVRAINAVQSRSLSFKDILDHSENDFLAYSRDGRILYSNLASKTMGLDNSSVVRSIPSYLTSVFEKGKIQYTRKSKGFLWAINGVRINDNLACFYIKRTLDVSSLNKAVTILDMIQPDDSINRPFYHTTDRMCSIVKSASVISKTNMPVLISGEPGTGKETLARLIHQQSIIKDNSFLTFNCRLLLEKQLSYLLRNENSPLGETSMGIYFKNIHYLSIEAQHMLISYIKDTSLHRRNRVFYSCTPLPAFAQQDILVSYLLHEAVHDCMTLPLPSLRERKEDLPGLANIYINEMNVSFGKQIAGLDAPSIELLQNFDWKQNIDELIKVLKELILISDGVFIRFEDTEKVLQKQKCINNNQGDSTLLNGTLDEIISNIIQIVFKEENMNQTQTAKRLGISRSTMWRKMKTL